MSLKNNRNCDAANLLKLEIQQNTKSRDKKIFIK